MKLSEKLGGNTVSAIALIVAGILFCALRAQFVSALLTVIGAILILLGIVDLVGRRWVLGAITLGVGIVIIVCGWTIVDITLLILGIVLAIYAVYAIASNISTFKMTKGYDKVLVLLNPLIMLAVGIMLIVARWYMVDAIFIVLGVIAIVDGVMLLFGHKATTDNSEN